MAVERDAHANATGGQEVHCRIVEQRRVGLHAEPEVVLEAIHRVEDDVPHQHRLTAVEDDLGPPAFGHRLGEVGLQNGQRLADLLGGHVAAATAHARGQVTVVAVEVAAFSGIEVNRGRHEAEPQVMHFLLENGRLALKRARQLTVEGRSHRVFSGHQRPERGVGLYHAYVGLRPNVDEIEMGPMASIGLGPSRMVSSSTVLHRLCLLLPVHQNVVRQSSAVCAGLAGPAISNDLRLLSLLILHTTRLLS